MFKYIFNCETTTPMFIAGADVTRPELRAPSIKGVLRFWWRAIKAGNVNLATDEKKIFGGVREGGQKSCFSIKVKGEDLSNYVSEKPLEKKYTYEVKGRKLNLLEYIAYGTYKNVKGKGNVFTRSYINAGYKFTIEITTTGETDLDKEILETMQVFFMFGALGAKSRNGFGGFRLIDSNLDSSINNKITSFPCREAIEPYLGYEGTPDYSAFSSGTKLYKTHNVYKDWLSCLAELSRIYRDCRLGLESRGYEKRQFIGAPIIVNKKQRSMLDRHAKPYFMRVNRCGDEYRGFILYLPSHYCTGLTLDSGKNSIDHQNVNDKFTKYCREFNEKLAGQMEVLV